MFIIKRCKSVVSSTKDHSSHINLASCNLETIKLSNIMLSKLSSINFDLYFKSFLHLGLACMHAWLRGLGMGTRLIWMFLLHDFEFTHSLTHSWNDVRTYYRRDYRPSTGCTKGE